MEKEKPLAKVEHLANWYFGNFCVRCGKIDRAEEDYGKKCYDKIHLIATKLKQNGTEMLKHKEFTFLIKEQEFCKPIKRVFHECPICKKLGVKLR